MSRLSEARKLAPYVGRIQRHLGLAEWDVTISEVEPESIEAGMSIWFPGERRVAEVHFSTQFFREDKEEQRYQVVHELTHLLLSPLTRAAQAGVRNRTVLELQLQQEERVVDTIAYLLAPSCPLPTWKGVKQ